MSIHVALHHSTTYRYDRPVTLSPHLIRLRPAAHCRSQILGYSLRVLPEEQFINWQQDPWGNYVARLMFPKPTTEFTVTVDLTADFTVYNPFDFFIETAFENWPFAYDEAQLRDLAPCLAKDPLGPLGESFLAAVRQSLKAGRTVDAVVELNRLVQQRVRYIVRMEPGVQTPEETLEKSSGSCRDSAWLLVQLARHLGLAARFVSGYLIQLVPDVKPLDGPAGTDKDFTDLHAWTELYIPGAGWIGLDPTSGLMAGEGHLPLACTPHYAEAAPVTGTLGYEVKDGDDQLGSEFTFAMEVTRIREDPRVTKPYTDAQWAAIDAMGRRIDGQLTDQDVRLTVGGEPTFVSIDDPDGEEWNTEAMGPNKRLRAVDVLGRLRRRFAPGGLLHLGQGKWYPGEQLPRWALSCYWRIDGTPMWRSETTMADEANPGRNGPDEAQAFISALARRLGVDPGNAAPGHEDAWYYLWRERRLPPLEDPLKADLKSDLERKRLAKLLDLGLDRTTGYALPLARWGQQWLSCRWLPEPTMEAGGLKRGYLFLVPGDSPMGFRLPLDSFLPTSALDGAPRDPFDERLPPFPGSAAARSGGAAGPAGTGPRATITYQDAWGPGSSQRHPVTGERLRNALRTSSALGSSTTPAVLTSAPPTLPPGDLIRTALCVEPRGGILYVFLPPQALIEDFLDLTAAIEDTAAETGLPVILEGYPPPRDPRVKMFQVTPDPGVIEVNVHPAASWDELSSIVTGTYEEARLARLDTQKFMVDGRHVGTGGGNHITLGGATPADSPFLRRPDVLRSLIAYWHNHPSLSYLFSGLFVGPTSQHPRADEARTEVIPELETALSLIPDHAVAPPWLIDRTLRHLLVDVTGNTHRTEFCIDKLFSPDSATGRLGLVELRGFEMPPHAQMSLACHALIRGLVASFWKDPYHGTLARWGSQLHDRFLLPYFVEQDFADVLGDLRQRGLPFADEWFAPHREFRFPRLGHIAHRGIALDLRMALEPWNVLGEESFGGGNARFVDSSVERIQLHLTGLPPDRYQVAVNGIAAPLVPTGTTGEFISGVRYRAWQPPSCLHPTIGTHVPLTVDLVDTWNGRAVAGCTYHVAHPGGRSYETRPVNAYEAEARRHARFEPHGHTPGLLTVAPPVVDRDTPFTLDLMRWK